MLANCSHFQYVSRSRLRVIQIGVKACIDVTLYDEPFVTSIIEKYILIPQKDNFDRCPVIYSWITILPLCQTHGKVHNRSGIHHGMLYRTYGWGIGNDFHSLSIFCRGFELLKNLVKVCTHWKNLSSVLIYLYRSWCPICKQLHPGLSLKNSFQTLLYAFQKILHHFRSTICHSHILIRKAVVLPLTFL